MPNWMKNKLTISGENATSKIARYINKDEDDNYSFDFNRVLPMPKSLHIERSTYSVLGFKLYLTKINPDIEYYGSEDDKLSEANFKKLFNYIFNTEDYKEKPNTYLTKEQIDDLYAKQANNIEKLLKYGRIIYENYKNYGLADWYDWSMKYWGVKWNASECEISDDLKTIVFDTPWSVPIPVIEELAKQNPDLTIKLQYAEEQTAFICGENIYSNGYLIKENEFDSYSREAYNLYFQLWGEDEDFYYDPKIGNYRQIYSE